MAFTGNAYQPLATNSGFRPGQTERLRVSTSTLQSCSTNQRFMSLERNYPSSKKEFLADQGERPGTRTFQPFVRNPTFQRGQTDIRAPPPPLNPEFTSVNRSQPNANVSRSSTTNAGFMSFSHSAW